MLNKQNPERRKQKMKSGKKVKILLRSILALLTILLLLICQNKFLNATEYTLTDGDILSLDMSIGGDVIIVNGGDTAYAYINTPNTEGFIIKDGGGTLNLYNISSDDDSPKGIIVNAGTLNTDSAPFSMNSMFNSVAGQNAVWNFDSLNVAYDNNVESQFRIIRGTANVDGLLSIAVGDYSIGRVIVDGQGSYSSASDGISIGLGNNSNGLLDISNGARVNAYHAYLYNNSHIGEGINSTGVVNVVGAGSQFRGDHIYLGSGDRSSGILNIIEGGNANIYGNLYIADGNNSIGRVTVDGQGMSDYGFLQPSSIEANNIFVGSGENSNGILDISGGATATTNNGYIGYGKGSTGVVNVVSAGSLLSISDTILNIGAGENSSGLLHVFGNGTATVGSNSGYNNDSYLNIAVGMNSKGHVVVYGSGSAIRAGNISLGDGDSSEGILDILNSAMVRIINTYNIFNGNDSYSYVGKENNSKGLVNVAGAGAALTLNTILNVGYGDNSFGKLNVLKGGNVTTGNGSLYIAYNASSNSPTSSDRSTTGRVVVDGKDSKLTASFLFVGYDDKTSTFSYSSENKGFLDISNGASVTSSNNSFIGFSNNANSNTIGVVNVAGGLFSTTNLLYIGDGRGSLGILNVLDGGKVTTNGTINTSRTDVPNPGGSGTINVSGIGSQLSARNIYLDNATLSILNSAYVEVTNTINVNSGSILAMNSSDPAGNSLNAATLSINGGSVVNSVRSKLNINTVNVANYNSTGRLNLLHNSELTAGILPIGNVDKSVGMVNAANNTSIILNRNNTNSLVVGAGSDSSGILNVVNGSTINFAHTYTYNDEGAIEGNTVALVVGGAKGSNGLLNIIDSTIDTTTQITQEKFDLKIGAVTDSKGTLFYQGKDFDLKGGQIILGNSSSSVDASNLKLMAGNITAAKLTVGESGILTLAGTTITGSDALTINGILEGNGTLKINQEIPEKPEDAKRIVFEADSKISAGLHRGEIGTLTLNAPIKLDSGVTFNLDLGKNSTNTDVVDSIIIPKSADTETTTNVLLEDGSEININLTSLTTAAAGTPKKYTFLQADDRIVGATTVTNPDDPLPIPSGITFNIQLNGENIIDAGVFISSRITTSGTGIADIDAIKGEMAVNTISATNPADPGIDEVKSMYVKFDDVNFDNKVLTWTGNTNNVWNLTQKNWEEDADNTHTSIAFLDGDAVTFDLASGDYSNAITLGGTGKTVAQMTVTNSTPTIRQTVIFNGNILADGSKTTLLTDKTGKLILDASLSADSSSGFPSIVKFNGSNEFIGGIDLKGGIIVLQNDKAFGTYIGQDSRGKVNVDLTNSLVQIPALSFDGYGAMIATTKDRILTNQFDDTNITSVDLAKDYTLYFVSQDSLTFENVHGNNGVFNFNKQTNLAFNGPILKLSDTPYASIDTNLASMNGGAIIFRNNSSQNNGGAINVTSGYVAIGDDNPEAQIKISYVEFFNNQARKSGGAIYNDRAIEILTLSGSLFANNIAGEDGGAIYNNDTLTIHGNTSFINNRANDGSGGAIYGNIVNVYGNTSFLDNIASGEGGAIYIADNGEINLEADTGDIAFTNNKSNSSRSNSLFLDSNVTLNLNLYGGTRNIYFDDPIASGTDGGNSLTKWGTGFVQFVGENILNPTGINTTSGNIAIEEGTFRLASNPLISPISSMTTNGSITFADNTTLAGQGILHAGQVTNVGGEDKLVLNNITFGNNVTLDPDGDRFDAPGGIGFNYATQGRNEATYSKSIGNYRLDGNVEIGSGITYKVDLSEELFVPNNIITSMPAVKIDAGTADDTNFGVLYDPLNPLDMNKGGAYEFDYEIRRSDDIVITGNIDNSSNNKINIALNNWVDGTFELMRAEQGLLLQKDWFDDSTMTVSGMAIGSRQVAKLIIDTVVDENNDPLYNRLLLVTATPFYNKDLLWTGIYANNQWDTTSVNWRDNLTSERETYNPGDYVIFNGYGLDRHNININNTVRVSGMEIIGGSQVFVSNINTDPNFQGIIGEIFPYNGQTVTGKLFIDTNLETVISIPTSFVNGTEIVNNGDILIGHQDALGRLTNNPNDRNQSGMVYFETEIALRIKSFGHTDNITNTIHNHSKSQNWFYVPIESDLTFETKLGTTWTIAENDGRSIDAKAKLPVLLFPQYLDRIKGSVISAMSATITINGGMRFEDNIAYNGHGAIDFANIDFITVDSILNLNSTNGNILFSGNHYVDNGEQHYLAVSSTGNLTINLTGSSNGNIFLDDPIQIRKNPDYDPNALNSAPEYWGINLVVDFKLAGDESNPNAFAQLRGENILNGNVTIKGGTLRLADDINDNTSSIDIGNKNFIVEKGGILAGQGNIKASETSSIKLAGTISPDSFIRQWDQRGKWYDPENPTYDDEFRASGYNESDDTNHKKQIGTIHFSNTNLLPPNNTPANPTPKLNVEFYGVTFNVDLYNDGNSGQFLKENEIDADKIVVDGYVSFGKATNTINIAADDWDNNADGQYVIIEANQIDAINTQWIVRYKGATIEHFAVNGVESYYLENVHRIVDDSRVVLAVLENDVENHLGNDDYKMMMILQLQSGSWDGDVIQWTGGGNWSDADISDKTLVILDKNTHGNTNPANKHDVITVVTENMVMSGLEARDKTFELQPPTRNSKGKLIINPNPEFTNYVANGLVYVHSGGNLYSSMQIKSAYGTLLGGNGTITYGIQDAFGIYLERYQDETHSEGRITARGNNNKIIADVTVDAKNRIVVEPNSELEIIANKGETLNLTNIKTSANGAAISVTNNSTLKLNGNILITNNTAQLIGNSSQFNGGQTSTQNGITANAGKGGGMYVENSNLIFDTTNGGIGIAGNKDTNGESGILFVTKNHSEVTNIILPSSLNQINRNDGKNEITFNGNSRYGVVFDDPIRSEYISTIYDPRSIPDHVIQPDPTRVVHNNLFVIDFDDPRGFVQFTDAELGIPSQQLDPTVIVKSGILHLAKKDNSTDGNLKVGTTINNEFWGSKIVVEEYGTIAGSGEIDAFYFDLQGGHVSPDNEKFTTTSSIIKKENLIGKLIFDASSYTNIAGTSTSIKGTMDFVNTTFDIDLKKGNESDKIIFQNNNGYTYNDISGTNTFTAGSGKLENNIININAWNTGLFTVIENSNIGTGSNAFPPDILDRFSLELGGDVEGSRQKAELLYGAGAGGGIINNYSTLNVHIEMRPEDRKRIVWTSDADGYLTTSSIGNWIDDNNSDEQFNHSDYIVFNTTGKQGEVVLGKPIYDPSGDYIGDKYGARTFSGLLIDGGNYTFIGGDFFGIAADFIDTGNGNTVPLKGDINISAGNITFRNNVYTEGNIAILQAAQVTLRDHKAFHAEGDFNVAETATLILEPTDNIIKANNINIAGTIKFINEPVPSTTNQHIITNIFESITPFDETAQEQLKEKVESASGLWRRHGEFNTNATSMNLIYNTLSIKEYAQLRNFSQNNTNLANHFDEIFNHWDWADFEKGLMNLNDDELNELFTNLSNAVIHSEAKYMALSNPYHTISNHLFSLQDTDNNRYNYSVLRGVPRNPNTYRDLWFSVSRYDAEMTGDGNAQNLKTFRSGFNIGYDKYYGNALLAGMMLSTGDAKLNQHQFNSRIDMEDYVFGLYAQYQFLSELQINSYIGFGLQKYKSNRQIFNGFNNNTNKAIYQSAKSEYNGDSAFWNVEVVRPIHWRPGIAFMPAVAIDIRYAHTDAFTENDYFNTQISGSKIDQILFRTGFNSLWKISDRFRLETHSWYSRQIGGRDTMAVNLSIPSIGNITPANLNGIKAGRDHLSLGLGGKYYLTNKKQSQITLDYIFERGNRSKAHIVNLGFNYNF